MKPTRTREDAVVDLVDVILRDGVIVQADVVISVADVALVGVSLRAAVAGMTTMQEYGMFEEWTSATRKGRRSQDE
jgi:hypothetical protein